MQGPILRKKGNDVPESSGSKTAGRILPPVPVPRLRNIISSVSSEEPALGLPDTVASVSAGKVTEDLTGTLISLKFKASRKGVESVERVMGLPGFPSGDCEIAPGETWTVRILGKNKHGSNCWLEPVERQS